MDWYSLYLCICIRDATGKSDEDAAFIDFYHVTNHMFAPTS